MNDYPASPGAGAPMVRFAGVSKRYGDLTVLDRLELASRLGEEHTTWRGDRFRDGDAVMLELGAAFRKY